MPNELRKIKLKNLAEIHYGKSPKAILADDGQIPVIGTGGVERFGKDYLFDGESIVLGRKGTIDNPVYVNGRFWAIDTTFYLRDFKETDVKWLYYFLRTINFRSMSEATGVPSLSRDFLYSIEVNALPKIEQTQIAAVLSCIDRAIEHTEALIAKQQRIKTGLMQDLLTKGIDEHGNIRSEATHEFKDSPLGRIPKEWEVTSLNDIGKWSSGGTPSKAQPRFWNGTIPWISSKDMKRFHLNGSIDYVTEEGANSGTRIVPKDTILIVVRGMVLAHTFPVGITTQDTAFNQDLKACVCNPQVSPMYLAYILLSNSSNLLRLTTEATHGTKRLDSEELFGFKIAIPKDKKEQNSIVNLVETFDVQLRAGKDQSDKLKVIKQGLMQDLLTGKVSVSGLLAESAAGIAS